MELGAGKRQNLLVLTLRVQATGNISVLNMHKVTVGTKWTNTKRAEGATGDIPSAALWRALLSQVVHKQAAAAIIAVTGCVIAPTQFRLILWVPEGNMELMETVSKLAALGIPAETSGRVAGTELCLVAGRVDKGDGRRGGGLH